MTIRSVIVDDEQNNIINLKFLLSEYCPEVVVVGEASNAEDGEKIILEKKPELVFLDIHLGVKSGLDMLQSLHNTDFEIIFITAFDKYGIQAIKFSALDYLLKPINIDELKFAVSKATIKIGKQMQNEQLLNLLERIEKKHLKDQHRIALPSIKEVRFVIPGQIIRCESVNNYTTFFLTGGEKYIVSKPIYEYDEMLEEYGFIRCHQSHLVNRAFIKSFIKQDGGYLLLDDLSTVPVSRQKKQLVSQLLEFSKR